MAGAASLLFQAASGSQPMKNPTSPGTPPGKLMIVARSLKPSG